MVEAEGGKLKLMVVDDEAENLDLLYRTFRKEFQIYKAESGLKALELLELVGEMAIIISDQRMPRMNGTEFLSRTVDRFPDTMRILLTGYTDLQDLVGAINTGKVFKYVTKPWSAEELKSVVQQAAETYRVVKQRTYELQRSLRRESIFNAVTTAIRESLDYCSMLQRVVDAIGQAFSIDACALYPIESFPSTASASLSKTSYTYLSPVLGAPTLPLPPSSIPLELHLIEPNETTPYAQLVVPLTDQQQALAVLILYQQMRTPWSGEEIQLIQTVAEQAALAISQAKLYQQIQQQTEQMRAELAVARQIQMNLLRQSWSTCDQVRIQAQCHPAREVGGDFFEVYVHPQGEIWLAVGDVSGKGIPAALFMASAISLLRRELSQENPPPPNRVLQNLNYSMSEELVSSNCFITMVLACYQPQTGELTYANAGHIYPIVWSHQPVLASVRAAPIVELGVVESGAVPEPHYLKVRGVPLGILPHWKAAAGQLMLHSGDIVLLTSDGITEATVITTGDNGEANGGALLQQTGLWKLLTQQLLHTHAQQQGKLDLDTLLADIQAHAPMQEDDQTLLSLEVL